MVENFQIDSYVSPNSSPEVLLACGPIHEIASYADLLRQTREVTVEAQADDGRTGFLKAHLGPMKYRDFLKLMNSPLLNGHVSLIRHAVPSSEHGRVDDVGNPHAPPVIVGILGDPETITRIREHLGWASMHPLSLRFSGEGVYFEPDESVVDAYADFVRDAEAGLYANVSVMLLRRVTPK